MTLSAIGPVLTVIGILLVLAGLTPFLRATDRKAKLADALTTAQTWQLRAEALQGERDDLAARITGLEERVKELEHGNTALRKAIEEGMRHD